MYLTAMNNFYLENFIILSFGVFRLDEVTKSDKNLWWGYYVV